ncbi:PRC-barrel domain containing protein [Sphingomonas sp. QA11]|uniref:PRC-barrel domain containing protein n=1 Tax=Sphingomonas sp. QA11 TaxID=2950605 RepID=UPI00234A4045|nr:PRC-barrel domain containing protein [Sphingomonas sp. QA11]WCM25896.1 PRC-barrel domain containing protein [Sphingomonas sp. QA11]
MTDIAGWVAPIATMMAAMMTAANLGSRVTGWGFVVFLFGAIAWVTVALATGQSNLLWSNVFLGLVDIIGIWRWLGRQATLDDGAARALQASAVRETPTLFPITLLNGAEINDRNGIALARSMGAMAEAGSGKLAYIVARISNATDRGGRHVALPWAWLRVSDGALCLDGGERKLADLDDIDPGDWPATAPC